MVASYVPDKGHLIWIDFDPATGREQAGRRPAIVLSPAAYNGKTSLAIVAPITSQKKGYSFEVELPANSKISGVVLSDHLKNIDWSRRNVTFAATAPREVVKAVQDRIALLLGFTSS